MSVSTFVLLKKMILVVLQGHVVILKVVPKRMLNLEECSCLRPPSVVVMK